MYFEKDRMYFEQLGEQAHKKQGRPTSQVDQHIHIVNKIFRSTDFSAIHRKQCIYQNQNKFSIYT